MCGSKFVLDRNRYTCAAHRDLSFDVNKLEASFLDIIGAEMMEDEFLESVLASAYTAEPDVMREERDRLAKEITNLTAGMAADYTRSRQRPQSTRPLRTARAFRSRRRPKE